MTISHPKLALENDEPVIFAQLGDVSCSVCAPLSMTKEAVEKFATDKLGEPIGGWEEVNKGKIPGFGSATPHACNIYGGRLHWFLLSGLVAAQFGFPTKK